MVMFGRFHYPELSAHVVEAMEAGLFPNSSFFDNGGVAVSIVLA